MPIQYTPKEFRSYVNISKKRHILVEGPTDKYLFTRLLEEIYGKSHGVEIENAEHLIQFPLTETPGNRHKVEETCRDAAEWPFAQRFVGFVDREYRGFDLGESLKDDIINHNVNGRLVWSRGHSIENYYFDFSTLEEPLRTSSMTEYFNEALAMFKDLLEATIRLACAVSLTEQDSLRAGQIRALDMVQESILAGNLKTSALKVAAGHIEVELAVVHRNLMKTYKLTAEAADEVVDCLKQYIEKVTTADFDVVRWLCRGHTGFKFIWGAYSRCVFIACSQAGAANPTAAAANALGSGETKRFNDCAESWVRKTLGSQGIYPVEVFQLLGLPTSQTT